MEITVLNTWSLVGLILDAVLLAWLVVSTIRGAKSGFVYSLVGLVTVLIAIVGGWLVSALLVDPVSKLVLSGDTGAGQFDNAAGRTVVQVAIALVCALIIGLLVKILGKGLSTTLNKIPVVGSLNQVLGGVFSLAVTLAFIFAALLAWKHFFPESCTNVLKGAPLTTIAAENNPLAALFGK
nr:CvpA family protein [Lachnospiraceae bacterium]